MFALHVHAFTFLFSFVLGLLPSVLNFLQLALPVYAFVALGRAFGERRFPTFWKGCVLGVTYLLLIAGVALAIAVYRLNQLVGPA